MEYGMNQLATVDYEYASTPGYSDMLIISEQISGITTWATWTELRDENQLVISFFFFFLKEILFGLQEYL